MLKDLRCGHCARLLARTGDFTELQIKCPRCGTLNHAKASSPARSPASDQSAQLCARHHALLQVENAMHIHERAAPASGGAP